MTTTTPASAADRHAIAAGLPIATVTVAHDETTGRFATVDEAMAFLSRQGWHATNLVVDLVTGQVW